MKRPATATKPPASRILFYSNKNEKEQNVDENDYALNKNDATKLKSADGQKTSNNTKSMCRVVLY
jgi:hypothetical protein